MSANAGWAVASTAFAGIPVTNALRDERDGVLFAALKHGHFGPKLHRSDDDGKTWRELPAPAFPADAAGTPSLFQIWTLESGGATIRTVSGSVLFRPVCSGPTIAAKAGSLCVIVERAGARPVVRRRL